jgi:hypothetical protein
MSSGFTDPFRYYLPPSEETLKLGMTSGLIVLDTNVLLSAYRFAPAPREELLSVLTRVTDRLWVPYRVAEEFHRSRLGVMADYDATYMPVIETLGLLQQNIDTELRPKILQLANRAALSDEERDKLFQLITASTEAAIVAVQELRKNHGLAEPRADDQILLRFQQLLDGKTGPPFSDEETSEAINEARRRAENRIPPGYRDANKPDPYGDYFIWKQTLLEVARRKSTYLVFVTGDNKEDWYQIIKGRTIGARPELARELLDESGAPLIMLNTTSFLFHAREYLDAKVSPETIRQSESLPRAELISEQLLREAQLKRFPRYSELQKLANRIDNHKTFIGVLQQVIADRLADDPEGVSTEVVVLRNQLERAQLSERTLTRRLRQYEAAVGVGGRTSTQSIEEISVDTDEDQDTDGYDDDDSDDQDADDLGFPG